MEFVVSIWYYNSVNEDINMWFYIIVSGIVGWAISIPITYICGSYLIRIYGAHEDYAEKYRKNKDPKYRDYITDQYELYKIKRYQEFYWVMICLNIGFMIASIALIQHMELNDHWAWFASVGGAWIWDGLICDVFIVYMAKCSDCLYNFFK